MRQKSVRKPLPGTFQIFSTLFDRTTSLRDKKSKLCALIALAQKIVYLCIR
jgi:hypothetical protein